jgi:IMP dehydrogenase
MTNGDVTSAAVPLLRSQRVLDHTKAQELLLSDFSSRDGVDVQTLLDPNKNGALTYNDFLVLPGYIGTGLSFEPCSSAGKLISVQALQRQR